MNRYSSKRGSKRASVSTSPASRSMVRLRAIIMLVLVAALAVSLVFGIPAINAQKNTHTFIVNRMATECKAAYDISQTMSLTASTNSYEKLARIRSSIYGMQLLSSTNGVMGGAGGNLIEEGTFNDLYSQIEAYNNLLITGMSTATQLTDLQNALLNLYDRTLLLLE